MSAVRIGACAMGMLALPSLALADPNSAFFSQQLQGQMNQQQYGPWLDSSVNIPQLTSTGTSGSSTVDLGAISAGQGGAMAGIGAGMQGVNAALPATLSAIGVGTGNSLTGGNGGGGGVSSGAVGATAATGALGSVLGFGR